VFQGSCLLECSMFPKERKARTNPISLSPLAEIHCRQNPQIEKKLVRLFAPVSAFGESEFCDLFELSCDPRHAFYQDYEVRP
jgi:hypothetical protein